LLGVFDPGLIVTRKGGGRKEGAPTVTQKKKDWKEEKEWALEVICRNLGKGIATNPTMVEP
jgi:hypothetical protein